MTFGAADIIGAAEALVAENAKDREEEVLAIEKLPFIATMSGY